jgi:hypothetical protein
MPFNDADVDKVWVKGKIGCGANRPTILVQHGGLAQGTFPSPTSTSWLATADLTETQQHDIIGVTYGHYVSVPNMLLQASGPFEGKSVFSNWQEEITGPPVTTDPNDIHHIGDSWWTKWTLDAANGSTVLANNPSRGGVSDAPRGSDFANQNTTSAWTFDFCARFGCGDPDGGGGHRSR